MPQVISDLLQQNNLTRLRLQLPTIQINSYQLFVVEGLRRGMRLAFLSGPQPQEHSTLTNQFSVAFQTRDQLPFFSTPPPRDTEGEERGEREGQKEERGRWMGKGGGGGEKKEKRRGKGGDD